MTTFGAFQSTRKTYDIVMLLLAEKEDIKIRALVIPVICTPLSVKIKNLRIPPELKGLKLADPSHTLENLEVDIIIENDYYGRLITGKIIKAENEALITMESKFGWLLLRPIHKVNCSENYLNPLCQRVQIMPLEDAKLDNRLTKF